MELFNACTLCNSTSIEVLPKYHKDYLVKCKDCGFVFCQRKPTMDELMECYSIYKRSNSISPITVNRYKELLSYFENFKQTGNIIDVGAGDGWFLAEAINFGWKTFGTEFEDRSVELCRQKGAIMHQGKLNPANYPPASFDVITSFEVIEHINNPTEEIQAFHTLLRKGGLLYVTTPNFNCISRRVLSEEWSVLNYPEHLSYYTPNTLQFAMEKNGFKKINLTTTAISLSRFKRTMRKETKTDVDKTDDEKLRQLTENSRLAMLGKNAVNAILNTFKLGDSMKGWFVKV